MRPTLYAISVFVSCFLSASLNAADGPGNPSQLGPAPAPQATASSQAGNGFITCAVGYFGVKLSPKDARGVTASLDGIQLKLTKVGDHYEMEPIGIPGPKPSDFKAPLVTVGDTDVTYDAGPMVVRWKMEQVFDLPKDWATVERISGKGPMAQTTITIKRGDGSVTLTLAAPHSRPETWSFKSF
jgi:hypothetical protein